MAKILPVVWFMKDILIMILVFKYQCELVEGLNNIQKTSSKYE